MVNGQMWIACKSRLAGSIHLLSFGAAVKMGVLGRHSGMLLKRSPDSHVRKSGKQTCNSVPLAPSGDLAASSLIA
jgi:hypothetical protein